MARQPERRDVPAGSGKAKTLSRPAGRVFARSFGVRLGRFFVAHVEKREYKRAGKRSIYWRARYRDPSGRERVKNFDRRVDAERFLTTVEADKLRGGWVDPALGRRLFREVAEEWQRSQVHRPSTVLQVETYLRRHVLPQFGDRPIGSIRPSEIQAWVKDRASVLAPATVTVVYRYLSAIFRMAVRDGLIIKTPCVEVRLPKIEKPRVSPMTVEQVEALLDAVDPRYRALLVLGAGAGLRQGEAFGLTVPHVDFLRRTIHVEQQLILLPGKPIFLGPPKTESSDRRIPVGDFVLHALAHHIQEFPSSRSLRAMTRRDETVIFTNKAGGPLSRTWFSGSVWKPAMRAAKLPEGLTFHDLRHFYASLLISRGASVKVIQARLGHKSAVETLDTYGHLWPDDEDLTRQAVDNTFGAAAGGVPLDRSVKV
jgi:integrase